MAPFAALASALLLTACVDPITGEPVGQTAAPALPEQPEIVTDATIYAARSDERFTVPALPVDQIPETYRRQIVDYPTELPAGTIVIDPTPKLLYYVLGKNKAIRYGIAVGADGFGWSGESIVANKRQWPTWTPPAEMIDRKPSLEKWRNGQPGGPTNPLGSRAIYLTSGGKDYGYRIHGTPEWKTIGRNASSGCFRMINQDVMDLFERVKGGERVIVLTAKGEMPTKLTIPPSPKPKKTAPKPAAAAVVAPPMIGPALPGAAPAADSPAPEAAPAVLPAAPALTEPTPATTAPAAAEPAAVPAVPAPAPAVTPAPALTTPAAPATTTTPAAPVCQGTDCPAN